MRQQEGSETSIVTEAEVTKELTTRAHTLAKDKGVVEGNMGKGSGKQGIPKRHIVVSKDPILRNAFGNSK